MSDPMLVWSVIFAGLVIVTVWLDFYLPRKGRL